MDDCCEKCGHRRQRDGRLLLACAGPKCTPGLHLVYGELAYGLGARRVYERHLAHDPRPGLEATGYVWAREGTAPDMEAAKLWMAEERNAARDASP